MGGNKERDAVRSTADSQARIAQTQENIANKYFQYSDQDRARQQDLYSQISPFAQKLMGTYNPDNYNMMAPPDRPDLRSKYKRDYADQVAGLEGDKNKALADSSDFYTSMGMGRSGFRGMGVGQVMAGYGAGLSGARRNLQDLNTGEDLAGYEDKWRHYDDTRSRRAEDINMSLQGANVLGGQQAVFNPYQSASVGTGNLYGATGSNSQAAQGYKTVSTMPTTWSKILGGVGSGLGILSSFAAPGVGGISGAAKNIWSGSN